MNTSRSICWPTLSAVLTLFLLVILAVETGCLPKDTSPIAITETGASRFGDSPAHMSWFEVQNVINNRCVTCHAAPGPAARLDFTQASVVREEALRGLLLERLNDEQNPMPPSGLLTEDVRRGFAEWIDRGAPVEDVEKRRLSDSSEYTGQSDRSDNSITAAVPFDVSERGFEFLDRMQGQWIGSMNLMGQDMPWFAFDYRAIGPAHVHGIFEGGTMGNLMTSFFYARFRGVDTLIARNGGILNGIYRTSYFVLDRVEQNGTAATYRFVDAIGGESIMRMSLTFDGDSLDWVAYTSRMGERPEPTRHMKFEARRRSTTLAESAAELLGFPSKERVLDLPNGFEKPDWGEFGPVTSASYMWQSQSLSYDEMGVLANDPVRIEHLPHLARLSLTFERPTAIRDESLLVYLSTQPLTKADGTLRSRWGYIDEKVFDSVVLFPEINRKQNEFTMTYVHPGNYSLTVIADVDADGIPGSKDVILLSRQIDITPGSHPKLTVDGSKK
ncbi:MAG: hypothetical protein ED559_02505 [Phycisphaera sp.]|nr:MAG: hypothetical protein ED559_02505 [Phycisphaera sp.]